MLTGNHSLGPVQHSPLRLHMSGIYNTVLCLTGHASEARASSHCWVTYYMDASYFASALASWWILLPSSTWMVPLEESSGPSLCGHDFFGVETRNYTVTARHFMWLPNYFQIGWTSLAQQCTLTISILKRKRRIKVWGCLGPQWVPV